MVLTVYGASRRQYQFEILPRHDPQPAVPGCYIFARKESDNRYTLIYIGFTGDLSERFTNHHMWPCIVNHRATNLCVYFTESRGAADFIEKDLLANYETECNRT